MKKTLRSRIFGVITSVMMTVMTFGSVLPEPSAFADDTEPVTITVKVKEQESDSDEDCVALDSSKKYFVLAGLYDKSESNANFSLKNPLAWNIQELYPDPQNPKPLEATFRDFREFHDGSASDDQPRIGYSPASHKLVFRVLRTKDQSVSLNCFADCYGENKKECYETFEGYKPIPSEQDNTLTLVAGSADYKLTINSEVPVNITKDDKLYVFVEITHASSGYTYYMEPLEMNGTKKEIVIQNLTHGDEKWMDNNGKVLPGERIHQNETQMVALVKADGKTEQLNMNNIIGHTNCGYIQEGGAVKSFKVSYKTNTEKESDTITHFTSEINLSKINAEKGIDFKYILGENVNFGIVANKFNRNHHMQSNFAALYYGNKADKEGGAPIEPDLTDMSGGEMLIGRIVTFNNDAEKNWTDSADKRIRFGQKHSRRYTVVRAPADTQIVCDDTDDPYVTFKAENVTGRINDMLKQMTEMSNELLGYNAISAIPTNNDVDKKYELDTTGFEDDATIFVDGDDLAKGLKNKIGGGNFTIKKKENQTIVFNFKDTDQIQIVEYDVSVYDDNGNLIKSSNTSPDVAYHSEVNDWLDKQITRRICFNLNSVKDAEMSGTAGIFLLPRADSVANNNSGTSTGWIITNGFFENGMEWHYVYSDVPDLPAPNPTYVTVSKTDITGEEEIENAELFIYASGDVDDSGNIVPGSYGKVPVYYKHWFSKKDEKTGKTTRKFGLADGDYVLLEKGKPFEYNGMICDVVTSVARFTIKNGSVIVNEQSSVKNDFNMDASEGYYVYDNKNAFTVCNAVIKPTNIKIIKTDEDGKQLEGAELELSLIPGQGITLDNVTSESADVTIDSAKIKIVTGKEDAVINGLPNGNYELTETAYPKHYENSDNTKLPLTFTLKNGHIKNVKDSEGNSYTSYDDSTADNKIVSVTLKNKEQQKFEINVTKFDITGKNEVEGAKLSVYYAEDIKDDGSVVEGKNPVYSWTSKLKNNTTAHSIKLYPGVYYLRETAEGSDEFNGKLFDSEDESIEDRTFKILNSDVKFTVGTDGKVSATGILVKSGADSNATDSYIIARDNNIDVCDVIVKFPAPKIFIGKYDSKGNAIPGVQLVLKGDNGYYNKWTSTSSDEIIKNLADGKYTLTEEPDDVFDYGYGKAVKVGNGKCYFVIDSTCQYTFEVQDGQIKYSAAVKDKNGGSISADKATNTIKVCDAEYEVTIKLTKVDKDNNCVGGAKFIITSNDTANPKTITAISEKNNWSEEITLPVGDYTIEEIGNENGKDGKNYVLSNGTRYKVLSGKHSFKVTEKGIATGSDVSLPEGSISFTNNTIKVTDEFGPTDLVIRKYDITGENELKGAKLVIKDDNDKVVAQNNGESDWTVYLENGTYYLEETAEDNAPMVKLSDDKYYKVIKSRYQFTVENGKVNYAKESIGDDERGTISHVENTNIIKVCNALATPIKIGKYNKDGNVKVAGATLTLTNKATGDTQTWKSDGNQTWALYLADGDYTLTEKATVAVEVEGVGILIDDERNNRFTYKVITEEFEFNVDKGKVTKSEKICGNQGKFIGKDYAVKVCDEYGPAVVKIGKYDITGENELVGAKLTISGVDNSFKEEWTSEAGKNWTVTLPDGKYTLKETAESSDGTVILKDKNGNEAVYKVIESEYVITIIDGQFFPDVTTDFDKENGEIKHEAGIVKVCNAYAPAEVKIGKYDITGEKQLKGAALKIYDSNNKLFAENKGKANWTVELPDGEYTLKETAENSDGTVLLTDVDGKETLYKVIESEYKITIKNGKFVPDSSVVGNDEDGKILYDSKSGIIKVCNALTPKTRVKVNKFDITGENELEGAELVIKSADGKFRTSWISKVGEIWEIELEDGTYNLYEKQLKGTDYVTLKDKDGTKHQYRVITSKLTFSVENGKIEYSDKSVGSEERGTISYDETAKIFKVCNAERTAKVNINKYNITGDTELAGAKLTISGGRLKEDLEWTSVIGETWTVTLPDGDYYLKETADNTDGVVTLGGKVYKVIESSYKFTVKDGMVKYSNQVGNDENGKIYEEDGVIKVCDAKQEAPITINKYDINGQKELAGAVLTVKDKNNSENRWTHVSSGKKGDDWKLALPDGDYTLTETAFNQSKDYIEDTDGNKYKIISSEYEFTVKGGRVIASDMTFSDGKVIVEDNTHFKVCDAEYDTPGVEVTFNKYNITGDEELPGAKLTIEGDNGIVESWTSVVGEEKTIKLPEGKYTLTETVDNDGKYYIEGSDGRKYTVIHSEYEFEVSKDGKVTASNKTFDGGKVEYDDNTKYFRILDAEAYEIVVEKKDITGTEEVIGASLAILDGDGKPISGINKWESGSEAKTFYLPDGEYILREVATDNEKGTFSYTDSETNVTRTYTVVPSDVKFTIKDGKVSSSDAITAAEKEETNPKESHVVFDGSKTFTVCDAEVEETKPTDVTVSKKGIREDGETELPGAKLRITSTEDIDWEGVTADVTLVLERDDSGKQIGISWTSGETEAQIKGLPNGTYVLEEFGDQPIEYNGVKYLVVESKFTFTVENGSIVLDESKAVSDDNGTIEATDKNTITVGDKEAPPPETIFVNKKGVTTEEELTGATLTLTGNVDWSKVTIAKVTTTDVIDDGSGNVIGKTWVSGGDAAEITGLPDGRYTLKETGDNGSVTDSDGNEYEVITSEFTFTISDGVITGSTRVEDENGSSIDVTDETHIRVSDAQKREITTDISISKKGITTEEELTGAVLTLTNKDVDWSNVVITNVRKRNVKDDSGRVIGKAWISGGDAAEITGLPNGTYELKESGDNGKITDSDGNEYEVITSVFEFTVEDGQIIDSKKVEEDNGTIDVTGINHIRVSDAQKEITTEITISKKGITTEEELTGAVLTLTNKDVDWSKVVIKNVKARYTKDDSGSVIGMLWISGGDAAEITGLPNGTYELKESGANGKITDSDGNEYEVITSVFEFTVKDGKITDSKKVEEDNGTIDVTGINHIRVSDAQKVTTSDISISKRSIVDNSYELGGAILTISNSNVDWSGVTVENVTATNVTDDNGKVIGKTWKSGSTPAEIKGIPNGTYTLEETGEGIEIVSEDGTEYAIVEAKVNELPEGFDVHSDKHIVIFGSDGSNYSIVESAFVFDVENGKITRSQKVQNMDGGNIESTDDNTGIVVTDAKSSIPTFKIPTNVTISKKAIDGEDELPGATLTLTNSEIDWSRVDIENEDELDEPVYSVTDDNNNVIGLTWVSGKVAAKIRSLPDGTYTLKETGNENNVIVDDEGNEYTVVESEFRFTTKEGKIIESERVENENDEGNIDQIDDNTIVVSDALVPTPVVQNPFDIEIRKTDVTGKTELRGASLKLTNENIDWTDIIEKTKEAGYAFKVEIKDNIAIGISWKSGETPFTVKGLIDAEGFELAETGDEFVAQDGYTYKVLTSVFKFDLADSAIANAEQIENEDGTGYTSDETVITVKDIRKPEEVTGRPTGIAITKHDITGEHEIVGASLTLTNDEIDWSEVTVDSIHTKVKDDSGKVIGISWISTGRSVNVRGLTDSAKYKLTENGTYFKSSTDGKYYQVLESEFEFELKKNIIVDKTQIDTTGGKYIAFGTSLKVCDAEAKNLVIINKTDITGENEINGAVIEIQDKDGNVIFNWTSKDGEVYEMILEDGEYKLVEKPADGSENIVDSVTGKTYKVLASEFKFNISDGKIVTVDSTEPNSNDGYVSFDGSYTLTVCDVEVNGGGDGDGSGDDSSSGGDGNGDGGSGDGGSGDGGNGGGSGNNGGGSGNGGSGEGGSTGSATGETASTPDAGNGGDTSGNPATGVGAGAVVTVALLGLTLVRRRRKDNEDKDQ